MQVKENSSCLTFKLRRQSFSAFGLGLKLQLWGLKLTAFRLDLTIHEWLSQFSGLSNLDWNYTTDSPESPF